MPNFDYSDPDFLQKAIEDLQSDVAALKIAVMSSAKLRLTAALCNAKAHCTMRQHAGHTPSLGNSVPTDPNGSHNSQQYI